MVNSKIWVANIKDKRRSYKSSYLYLQANMVNSKIWVANIKDNRRSYKNICHHVDTEVILTTGNCPGNLKAEGNLAWRKKMKIYIYIDRQIDR